jgi:hypothetical protein
MNRMANKTCERTWSSRFAHVPIEACAAAAPRRSTQAVGGIEHLHGTNRICVRNSDHWRHTYMKSDTTKRMILLVTSLLFCGVHTIQAAERALSPSELVRTGGKALWDNTTRFRVRFEVQSVRSVPTIFPDGERHTILHLVPSDSFSSRDDFTVPISREVEATLHRIGVTDIAKHFTGKVIEVEGVVSATGLDLILSETRWTYHVTLRSLDQICHVPN